MRQLIAAAAAAMVPLTGVLTAGASTPRPVAGGTLARWFDVIVHRQELTPAQPA